MSNNALSIFCVCLCQCLCLFICSVNSIILFRPCHFHMHMKRTIVAFNKSFVWQWAGHWALTLACNSGRNDVLMVGLVRVVVAGKCFVYVTLIRFPVCMLPVTCSCPPCHSFDSSREARSSLTHLLLMPHICVSESDQHGLDNDLSPVRHQAII